jgi:hypothetical protein
VSIHTCSYFCDRPECVLAQRDELRQKLEQAEKQWVGLTDEEVGGLTVFALIEDLRLNHEFCPKEVILQAADELERMQQGIETLHALYEQAVKQRDYLMDQQ